MPCPSDRSDRLTTLHRLRQKIDQLTEQQTEALRTAVYVGMSPSELKAYDDRHAEILQLLQQLAEIEKCA